MVRTIVLDGKEYRFDFNLNVMVDFEDIHGHEITPEGKMSKKEMRTLIWLCLKEENPEITEQEVGKLINPETINEFNEKLSQPENEGPLSKSGPTSRPKPASATTKSES